MKTFLKLNLLLTLATVGGLSFAQPAKKADDKPVQPVRSVFEVPATLRDGRDPFFPESTRGYAVVATNNAVELNNLAIKGFSGLPGNRMVIINNHTFAVGDDSEVTTASGRVHIRCLMINANSVLIEANGQQRTLTFTTQ